MLWRQKLSVSHRLQLFWWRPKLTETYVFANINSGSELLFLLGLFHCELSTHGLLGVREGSLMVVYQIHRMGFDLLNVSYALVFYSSHSQI